ncbi:hypothetical protein BTN49_2954 [Candidatus Enterovibrio escicola]|uniref:Transposase DDE domain-containing protein n=1 Tax=Candidatus Enterovibrio escicola TaxID=1927127 RepID=A0A2A5SZT6_9GAMM|nr:hypothetical protein BTN49_2954 [Candidatus Enterovibrio escacola]
MIEAALMVKGILKLPVRELEGFLNSVLTLMNVPLKFSTYTRSSKRSKNVKVKYRLLSRGVFAHVFIDDTGLKVYG